MPASRTSRWYRERRLLAVALLLAVVAFAGVHDADITVMSGDHSEVTATDGHTTPHQDGLCALIAAVAVVLAVFMIRNSLGTHSLRLVPFGHTGTRLPRRGPPLAPAPISHPILA